MSVLHTYIPQDRLRALSHGETLPNRTTGSALFADISGFTPLTETLTRELGPRRGIEELTHRVNTVYDALIAEIEKYGGSVISFAGDAITCWFDGDRGQRAVSAALGLQKEMDTFPELGLKVGVTTGPARRFVVGEPSIQVLDALAGHTVARLAMAEHLARKGEVVVDEATAVALAHTLTIQEWRSENNEAPFAVIAQLNPVATPFPPASMPSFDIETIRPWILPAIFEREQTGLGDFLTELRPATALFLRFTGIDYDNDEQAGEKLSALIRHVQIVLRSYEGTLMDLNIGDKGSYLYIAFGVPIAHEDDARRSVQSALELQCMVLELHFQEEPFLQSMEIGISSGMMRTGAYGGTTRRTYGALGDETNLAARLMSKAAPGETLISKAVQKQISTDFAFKAYPPIPIKGKEGLIPVFGVTSLHAHRAIRLGEPPYALPMMGRQTELALISEKLQLVLQGKGQIIGIIAEAGMGKSRLVTEVIRMANQQGFAGYGGACESSGTNTPYLVWKPIWQAFFDINPTIPSRQQIQHLESEIKVRAPLRLKAVPLLSLLLDVPIEDNAFTRSLEPKDRRNVLTAVLEDCLRSAAAIEPLLFVLEDLHWIDAVSHDLLETLCRISINLPICFVLAYRPPEAIHLQAPRVENLSHFTHLTLNQLAPAEVEQLITAKLNHLFPTYTGTLSPALITELTTRAEGNPFYIEELLNYIRDRGLNPYDETTLYSLELPTSLHALILSRIDRLSETQKVMLKTASIIGRMFSLTWLYGYYPALGAVERVKADLGELAQLDLTPFDKPEPELAYLFKHIVTHEVAYESLTYATRAQLHEQLAQFIETQGVDRYLDLLAFHYSRSENVEKQRIYLQKAGKAAQADFANEAALDYFTRLLPLIDDPYEQLKLLLKRGTVLELLGQWSMSETEYRTALSLSEKINRYEFTARCQRALGKLFGLRGDYPAALTWLEQARNTFLALGDPVGLAITLIETGRVWWQKGEYANARQDLEAGLALAQALENKQAAALALSNLGSVARNQGDYVSAQALHEKSLQLRREIGDKWGIAMCLSHLGLVANSLGNYDSARALYEESLFLNQEMGDKRGIANAYNNLGIVAGDQNDYASAQTLHEKSLALKREMGDKWGIAASLNNLGLVACSQRNFASARTLYEESLALNREMGDKWGIAMSLVNLGNLVIEQDDIPSAKLFYQESLQLCRDMGDKKKTVYNMSGLAAVAAKEGNLTRAAQLAATAETLRVHLGMAWEPDEGRIYKQALNIVQLGLKEDVFQRMWVKGQEMALDEAFNYALMTSSIDMETDSESGLSPTG